MEKVETAAIITIDVSREEGELSDDGEIIELSDGEPPCDSHNDTTQNEKNRGDSPPKSKTKRVHRTLSPKRVRNDKERASHIPKSTVAMRKRDSPPNSNKPTRRVGQPPRRRSRSRSRERARFPGYCRDSARERELALPKSYQSSRAPSSTSKSKFWDLKRMTGTPRLRFHGSMNIRSESKLGNASVLETTSGSANNITNGPPTNLSTQPVIGAPTAFPESGVAAPPTVVPLMALVVDPPPPPPPPPPPLPSSPPPQVEPPPPPPPSSRLPPELKLNVKRKPHRSPRIVPPRSPPGEVDNDYIDLLLEYKQIQKQLENIKREEERAASLFSGDESKRSNSKPEFDSKNTDSQQKETNYKDGSSSDSIPPWRKKHTNVDDQGQQEHSKSHTGEDDDLDELELRLAALASAAKRGSKLERSTPKERGNRPSAKQSSSGPKKRGRESWRRESTSSTSSVNKRRHLDEEPPWIRRDRRRREEERRWEEEQQVEEEKRREEQRRREVQKILTLDNPEEQVERFLRLCRGTGEETKKSPHDFIGTESDDYEEDDMADNYEVKEMEIDSDISSPQIVIDTGNEDIAEDLMAASVGMMEMPPVNFNPNFYPPLQAPDSNFQHTLDPSDYFHPMEMPFLLPQPQGPPHAMQSVAMQDQYTEEFTPPGQAPVPRLMAQVSYPTTEQHVVPLMDLQIPVQQVEDDRLTSGDVEVYMSPGDTEEEDDVVEEPLPYPADHQEEMTDGELDNQEGDEAEALRALLLQDMKKKSSIRGLDEESKSSRGSSPLTIPKQRKDRLPKKQLTMPMPPRHEPVVISLGASSDSDDSDYEHNHRVHSKPDFSSSIDQFLKDARQASENVLQKTNPLNSPTTPEALKNLPQDKLNEYKKLKQEIKRREQKKVQVKPQPNLPNEVKSAAENKPEPRAKSSDQRNSVSLKVQLHGGQRKVKTGNSPAKPGTTKEPTNATKNAGEKPAAVEKPAASEKPAVVNEQYVRQLEAKLAGERVSLEEDESVLLALRGQVTKRKLILKTAEQKAKTLQEQLAAAERIVDANRQQIQKYVKQGRAVKARVDRKCDVVHTLEKQVMEAGQQVFGEKYDLQLPSINNRSPLFKTKAPLPKPANAEMNALAKEKKRLLHLEKVFGDRIRKLKEAQKGETGASAQNRTVLPLGGGSIEEELQRLRTDEPEKIITAEKINLTSIADSDLDKEMVTITPRRRRSLLDLKPNTNPLIVKLEDEPISEEQSSTDAPSNNNATCLIENPTTQNRSDGQSIVIHKPTDEKKPNINNITIKTENTSSDTENDQHYEKVFSSFSKLQMTKLRNLQASNLMKFPTSGLTQVMSQDPSLSPSWWPKQKQVNSRKLDASVVLASKRTEVGQEPLQTKGLQSYSSALLTFRSYRFNPYFRTKEKQTLSSATYAHKLDVGKVMCKFELHGTCNDEKCPWQHKTDYELMKHDQLRDIVSYCPTIASVKQGMPKEEIFKRIDEFVDRFSETNKSMTHEEQILLLLTQVDTESKTVPPHYIRTDTREWRVTQTERDVNLQATQADRHQTLLPAKPEKWQAIEDNIIGEGDVRYWLLSGSELEDMETAVLDSPNDVHMWLKLAYKKLHEGSESKGVDKALNVFAHALQANKTSEKLWLHYLGLYSRRSDASDLLILCEQAVKYAPSYQVYWKYLGYVSSFDQKESLCDRIKKWLCEQVDMDKETRSHQLLEIILYQISLCVATGRLKVGVQLLKTLIQSTGSSEEACWWHHLSVSDKAVLSLTHIHLMEFRSLPSVLYDPTSGLQAYIVSKDIGEFGWREGKGSKLPIATLDSMFRDVERQLCKGDLSSSEYIKVSLPIYTNWLHLLACSKKFDAGKKLCRRVLKTQPTLTKLWLILARLEAKSDNVENARQVLRDGLEANPSCTEIYYSAAQLEISQENPDSALEILEEAVISLYDVDQSNSRQCDPNLLYSYALGQPVPMSFTAPPFKSSVSPEILQKEPGRHLWLSYCLLLDLQGDHHQVGEVYEVAVAALTNTTDLQALWTSYLRYTHGQAISCSAAAQQAVTARLCDLVQRCLVSSPVRFPIPHQHGTSWLDYRFHNEMIDILVRSVPRDQIAAIYERFISMMPGNVQLICRACEEALRLGDRALARGITTLALMDHPGCLQLWKTHLRLAQWNSTYSEVKKTFQQAIQHHPLVQHIWKDYLLYEVVHGTASSANSLIAQCRGLGVHINDYVVSLVGSDTEAKT